MNIVLEAERKRKKHLIKFKERNRDKQQWMQWKGSNREKDREIVTYLIEELLKEKEVENNAKRETGK